MYPQNYFAKPAKQGFFSPRQNRGWAFSLPTITQQPYFMEKAGFYLLLALNADQQQLISLIAKYLWNYNKEYQGEAVGRNHRTAPLYPTHLRAHSKLFQPRTIKINLLWSRVGPLHNKPPAKLWKSQAFAHGSGSNESNRKLQVGINPTLGKTQIW